MVDFQCGNFYCTAKWFSCPSIHSLSFSLSLWLITVYWIWLPVIYNGTLFTQVLWSFNGGPGYVRASLVAQWLKKKSTSQCWRCKRHRFDPWVGKIPWNRKWQPAPVFLPEKFHGQKSLAVYSPWGCKV